MIGGRTRPEVEPVEEGRSHTHTGTILVIQGNEELEEKVSHKGKNVTETKEVTNLNSHFAGMVQFHQDCGEECAMRYEDLKNNMKRVWDLESEGDAQKLANTYYPSVRSQRQM